MVHTYKTLTNESPIDKAVERTRRDVDSMFSQYHDEGLKDSVKSFVSMFAVKKPVGTTSPMRTSSILKQARIAYFPPQNLDKRLEAVKQAAKEHLDARLTQKVASKKIEEELEIAMQRLQNKYNRESNMLKQRRALEVKIKHLDESAMYVADLQKTVSTHTLKQSQLTLSLNHSSPKNACLWSNNETYKQTTCVSFEKSRKLHSWKFAKNSMKRGFKRRSVFKAFHIKTTLSSSKRTMIN